MLKHKSYKYIFALIILLFISNMACKLFAENKLIVSILYGKVYASTEGDKKNEKRRLSPGDELRKKDIIHILDNKSYLVLNNPSGGNPLELKVQGVYYVKDIIKHYTSESTDFIKIYWEMIVKKMKQSISGSPGGTERNIKMFSAGDNEYPIKVISPPTTRIMYPLVNLIWHKDDSSNSYLIQIFKSDRELVVEYRTCDTFAIIDLSSKNLEPNICYYWLVHSATNPNVKSEEYCFLMLSSNFSKLLNEEIEKIKEIYPDEKSPLKHIILAQFFESNGLLMDAYKHYQIAVSYSKDIEEYKNLYAQFCLRTGLR